MGVIVGKIVDAKTGDGIATAAVEETATGIRVDAEADGSYRLNLQPGTYELRAVAPFYKARFERNIVVRQGAETRVDIALEPIGAGEIELLEVVAEAYGGSEASQLLERKLAPTLSDNISAEMIKLSPDSDVAEIVQRMPAVTIQDNKYLNVRGLNERYTAALLNNSRLPSTDPLRRAVPLDIFPAGFIESISIVKTYTPDLPGDFSGGLANIKLEPYPEQFTLDVGVSTSVNSSTTFRDFRTYKGAGAADWFGYGDGFRGLPGLFPDKKIDVGAPSKQRAYASSFRNIWDTSPTTAAPGYGVSLSAGGKPLDRLGTALGVTYGTDWKFRDGEIARTYAGGADGEIQLQDDFTYARSTFETSLGVVSNTGYQFADGHDLTFRGIYNRQSQDEVLDGLGDLENQRGDLLRTRYLEYTANELGWGQLDGSHRWDWIEVDWRTALSRTMQDQPDGRFDNRNYEERTFSNASNGGRRVFSNLEEVMSDSAVDFTIPFRTRLPFTDLWSGLDGSFKLGPAYMFREREHTLRNFRYDTRSNIIPLNLPTEELFQPQNIFTGGVTFKEETQPRDAFRASHEIAAIYGMLELPLLGGWTDDSGQLRHQLRLIGGLRTEYSYIVLDTVGNSNEPLQPILNDLDPLPGVNLIYSPIEDVNLRLAWSQAVSRPELRELSPVQYPAPGGLRPIAGNAGLISASIDSYDARAEWFFGPTEVLSCGVFYKELENPIEAYVFNQGSVAIDSYTNADSATIVGAEVEVRAELHRLSRYLDGFSFTSNVTYTNSKAKIGAAAGEGTATTSSDRELQGQAPFVVNASIDYTHDPWGTARLLYNTIGDRLTAVGRQPLPDIFEKRRDQLDLVYLTEIHPFGTPLSAKLAVENILDDDFVFVQGKDAITTKYKTGVSFSFSLSYSY